MGLDRLLSPRSVVVVGATDRIGTYAAATLMNLRRGGFTGTVVGVHPTRTEVLGYPCVPRLERAGAVDAVVIATPAPSVAQYVAQAREAGCGGAIVYAADFAESGNVAAQQDVVAAAGGLPVIGPNGNGVVSVAQRAALWGDAVNLPAECGPIALVTQSGNVGVIALAHRGGLGLHTVVSVGNSAVTDASHVLAQLAVTDGVRVVAMYLEADGDGARLAAALATCADRDVRVVVLKAGRSPAGAVAGAAHTAALAGDHRVYSALIEAAGGVVVREPAALIETARALAAGRRDSRGAALITCSGGDAAMAADIAHDAGVRLAEFGAGTVAALRSVLPVTATPVNPLDHTNLVWADTEAIAAITEVVARDEGVGHLVYVQDEPPGMPEQDASEWRATRAGGLLGAERAGLAPIVACTTPGQEPEGAVSGLTPMLTAITALQRPVPEGARLREIAEVATRASSASASARSLPEHEAKAVLAGCGVEVPESVVVESPSEAAEAATRLGFPVALKLSAAGLMHKSEIGAVEVGLRDADAVEAAASRMLALARGTEWGDAVLLVERMAAPGVEMLVSASVEGVVPSLVIGLGGVWAEVLDDVVVLPLPVTHDIVNTAVLSLRGAGLLTGARGREPLAVDALVRLACTVATLLVDRGLGLVELNPVIVSTMSAVAVDAVIH